MPISLGSEQKLPDAIEKGDPYPIKAAIFYRHNPLRAAGDSNRWRQALAKLDLLVVIDTQMNEAAALAHYVLPEHHYLERMEPVYVAGNKVAIRQPVVPPLYDTRSGFEIVQGLARAVGLEQYFNFTIEEYNEALLSPTGWNLAALMEQGVVEVPATPYNYEKPGTLTGKVQLAQPLVRDAGGSFVPQYEPPLTRAEGDRLQLLHGRGPVHTHTYTLNIAPLHHLMPENELWIHPSAAAARGIKDGDLVEVANEVGVQRIKARVTEGIRPDCVWMHHGFGCEVPEQRLAYGKGANDSALYPILTHPISGALGQGDATVTVRKVGG